MTPKSNIKARIQKLLQQLNYGLVGREEVISLVLLSSIAGESIFLLGAPGVAKSLIARRLKYAFKDGNSFEYLMNRFSTPDEIFGPVSISQLKDHNKYERIVKNYLPTAKVVFLDEIWKPGPSIQNALLTVLNEKIYRNGEEEIHLPMEALISASNELPSKGEGLEAIWDRFLVRLIVDGVKDKNNFNKMISEKLNSYDDNVDEALKISDEEYKNWSKEIDNIEIPSEVFNVIDIIRHYLNEYNQKKENQKNPIYISDRRWRKIVRLLRTSAFLNGRKAVDLMDCFLIKHCIWNDVEQIRIVSMFVMDAIQKHGYSLKFNFNNLTKELDEFKTEIKEETNFEKDTRTEIPVVKRNAYFEIAGFKEACNLIDINDFNSLSSSNKQVNYWDKNIRNYKCFNTRRGNSPYSLFINDAEYKLKTRVTGEYRKKTKKPHQKVEEYWDSKVEGYLQQTP